MTSSSTRRPRWNPDGRKRIIHIDTQPAEVDAAYRPEVELSATSTARSGGCSRRSLPRGIGGRDAGGAPRVAETLVHADLRTRAARGARRRTRRTTAGRSRPQRAIADLRRALGPSDIVVSDVGAHKVWVARLYQAYEPNTVIICNGFAAMGIAVPGAIAAKLVHPDRKVVALCGDGGFLMNSQELETAKRIGAQHHRRRLARRRLRPDRLEAAQRVRAAVRGRVRQPGLRRLRPVVRHRRLPAGVRRRPVPDPHARARRRRAVARRRPDRLPREPAADRAAGRAGRRLTPPSDEGRRDPLGSRACGRIVRPLVPRPDVHDAGLPAGRRATSGRSASRASSCPVRSTVAVVATILLVIFDFQRTLIPHELLRYDRNPGEQRLQAHSRVFLFFVVPLAIVIVGFRDRPSRYGLRLGDWRWGLGLARRGLRRDDADHPAARRAARLPGLLHPVGRAAAGRCS